MKCLPKITRVILLLASLVGGGCVSEGQKNQISKFSAATSVVIDGSQHALALAQESELENQIDEVVQNEKELRPMFFTPLLDKDAIDARLEILDSLQLYADGLLALIKDDESAEIAEAAQELSDSASALVGRLSESQLSDKEKTILGQVVFGIGSTVVEAMRGAALRKTVSVVDTNIQIFVDLMQKDLGTYDKPTKQRTGLRAKIFTEYQSREATLSTAFKAAPTAEKKDKIVRNYISLLKQYEAVDGLISETHQSLGYFASTHTSLKESLDFWNVFGSFDALKDQVDTMAKHVKKIRDYQKSLKGDDK